jgi:hypothetical protein
MKSDSEQQPPQMTHSLKNFEVLIGEWSMVGSHPELPTAVHGHSVFEWLREDALLVWHFNWESGQGVPSAYSIIGHDDSLEPCSMLYTDERGVSRIYQMSLSGGVWKMWRESPGFSQRMTASFSNDNNTINWQGDLSRDGSSWETDLSINFTKK